MMGLQMSIGYFNSFGRLRHTLRHIRHFTLAGTKRRSPHPWLNLEIHEPVFHRWDPSEIVSDMLLTDEPHGYLFARTVAKRDAQQPLAHKNPLGVMSQRAVPKVGHERLRFIEPVMHRQIVRRLTAKKLGRSHSMMVGMSHRFALRCDLIEADIGGLHGTLVVGQCSVGQVRRKFAVHGILARAVAFAE